jgi:hypothetical protein
LVYAALSRLGFPDQIEGLAVARRDRFDHVASQVPGSR